ncbi:NADP-dependent 3-hydroxy acid dehydrogenase YdfG [Cognatiyoonia sediminum]|uniref:NADP-dependent 3-hydroxy acid dehydrogenase YdfG n=1 Tax=Cognatiyoonia sediminum TaxID=1508389 RepID=A0A1M5NJ47_9RHOB|nr:SDR family oxidoreductase [Cognatiyoonia sediminum]SHG89586.1 NADP-dependent 3-hydroxy acid dehydrogenase YdfG [Cognatiyoonia sediminum]
MKTIMVTGASGGIGRAVAETFLAEGWIVGLMARREAALQEVAQGRKNAVVLTGDVTKETDVEAAFEALIAKTNHLDVLFNNAGIFTSAAPVDEISLDDWQSAVDVNLTGMFLAARAAFRQMRRQDPQGGRIINNGSISAHVPREGSITYTATKHGVTGLTRTISLDGRPFNIACGQIDIGNAETDMLRELARRAVENGDAPPPMMDVQLVADAVLSMANLPLNANVQFQTLMATQMPYIGRG